jgi:hypothetical protein
MAATKKQVLMIGRERGWIRKGFIGQVVFIAPRFQNDSAVSGKAFQ